jgi:glycosyltransferase involved in cell wall biosynthesis
MVPGRPLFLTPQVDVARKAGATAAWAEVRTVAPSEVPAWLRRGRAAVFFYKPGPFVAATFPTKFAEALASGLPVVTNSPIGDLDEIVESERVGVFVKSFDAEGYRQAVEELRHLLEDPETQGRCRRLAESRFGVDLGVRRYHELYLKLASGERG